MDAKDWYAKKLGGGQRTPAPSYPPQAFPQPGFPQQQPQQPVEEPEYRPKGATHLRRQSAGACPECDSPNYMSISGGRNGAVTRCYDCGYPIVQSGSGPSIPTGAESGPPQPAVQINKGGNWNPGGFAKGIGIIGKDPSVPI